MDYKPSRNRAKCKKCGDIIESKHARDYVSCSCKEISMGAERQIVAVDWENLLIVNDDGSEVEINVNYKEKEQEKNEVPGSEEKSTNREELLGYLDDFLKHTQTLPPHVRQSFVTYYDLEAVLEIIYEILKAKN